MTWTPARRRIALGAAALVVFVLALLLVAARLGEDGEPSSDRDGDALTPTTSSGGAGTAPPKVRLPSPAAAVESDLSGARVRLEVQPLVRAGSVTVLTAVLRVVEAPEGGSLNITADFTARRGGSSGSDLSDVRLFVPEPGLLVSPATGADGQPATSSLGGVGLKRGDSAGLRVVFGALPSGVGRTDVLWPIFGVIPNLAVREGEAPELPPYGDAPARDVELAGIRGGEPQPVTARFSELQGAVKTEQAPDQTRVVLAADVLFALDRADLSPQANVALDRAAAAIEAAGPGPVKVTGHTDDQGSDQYNLDLSNRRAQAVAAALASRLPPDRYPPEISGRGDAEPSFKGTTADARAANRRVELFVSRRQQSQPATTSRQLPPGGGPSAKGAEGLVLDQSNGSKLRLRAERAVREGTWLRVDMTAAVERPGESGTSDFLVDLRDASRGTQASDASGVGVLDGAVLRLPAVDPTGTCACPNTLFGLSIVGLEQRKLSLWVAAPASVGGTVVVQLPKDQGRLFDVPVTT